MGMGMINEVAKGIADDLIDDAKRELKAIEEAQMWAVAGMSLSRPISANDIRWAVEKGFEAGKRFVNGGLNE